MNRESLRCSPNPNSPWNIIVRTVVVRAGRQPIADFDQVVRPARARCDRLIHRRLPHQPGVDRPLQDGHTVHDFRSHLVVRVHERIRELVIEVRLNGRVALRHPVLAHGEIVVDVNDSLLTAGRPDRVFLFKLGIDVSVQADVSIFAVDDEYCVSRRTDREQVPAE